jgi:hypothetical protein
MAISCGILKRHVFAEDGLMSDPDGTSRPGPQWHEDQQKIAAQP